MLEDKWDRRSTTNILLAVATALLVVAGLRASQPVTMPLAFGVFLAMLMRPVHQRLRRHVPRWLSLVTVLLILAAIAAAAGAAVAYAVDTVADRAPHYRERLEKLRTQATEWAAGYGLELPQQGGEGDLSKRALRVAAGAVRSAFSVGGLMLLIVAFMALLLLELQQFGRKLDRAVSRPNAERISCALETILHKFHRYFLARTLLSAINGAASGLLALAVGLDFAIVWGLLAFVLNFVPTIGSIVAVVPPVLQALVQFDGLGMPLLVLATQGALQIVLGNFLDPKIEGRMLLLSPFVVLASIVFWGWVWGIGGALLGVPLTVSLVIACEQSERLRPIGILLSELPDDEAQDAEGARPAAAHDPQA